MKKKSSKKSSVSTPSRPKNGDSLLSPESQRLGFTLPELLITATIIALLASAATVSYESARTFARDIKRVADLNAFRTALELYYQNHQSYPPDGQSGAAGVILGTAETRTLSDEGFAAAPEGLLYLVQVPENPSQGGVPYVFRSMNPDGSDCDAPPCADFEVVFALEGSVSGLESGIHTLTSEGVIRGLRKFGLPEAQPSFGSIAAGTIDRAVFFFQENAGDVLDNPVVERGAESVIAPVATVGLLSVIATAAPLASIPRYFLYFFSQPFLYFVRRKRHPFGVVYDAYTKLPLDLAIVRLKEIPGGAIARSAVTDKQGRFHFFADHGSYRLEVTKPGFLFPSVVLRGKQEDGEYLDLYHGDTIRVERDGDSVAPNVPLDPTGTDAPDSAVRRQAYQRNLKHGIALSGPVLAIFSFAAAPTAPMAFLVLTHFVLYFAFRKLSLPVRLKDWGVVYDEASGHPVQHAVLRMFALPYHKLISTAIADSRGRYNFLVGPAELYITVTKEGFAKTETEPLDLRDQRRTVVIATDLPLRRLAEAGGLADVTVVSAGPAKQPGSPGLEGRFTPSADSPVSSKEES